MRVDEQGVGARPGDETPRRSVRRCPRAFEHAREQPLCRRRLAALGRGGDVALASREPLTVFDETQLLAPVARRVAVGAERERHAGREPARQVEQAVAEVGLGARTDDDARAARCDGFDLRRRSRASHARAASADRARAPPATRSAVARSPRGRRRPRPSARRRGCGSARRVRARARRASGCRRHSPRAASGWRGPNRRAAGPTLRCVARPRLCPPPRRGSVAGSRAAARRSRSARRARAGS